MENETFGKLIREKRKELGLSLRELARRTGVSHPYLSQLENERNKNPSLEIVIKLSNELELSLSKLLELAGISLNAYEKEISTNTLSEMNRLNNKELSNLGKLYGDIKAYLKQLEEEDGIKVKNDESYKVFSETQNIILNELSKREKTEYEIVQQLINKNRNSPITPYSINSKQEEQQKELDLQRKHKLIFELPAFEEEKANCSTIAIYVPIEVAKEKFFEVENLLNIDPSVNYKGKTLTKSQKELIISKIDEIMEQQIDD